LPQLLLKLLALRPFLGFAQGSLYCGHQTGGPRFQHIIRGALLERINRCFLADCPREKDEWCVGTFCMCKSQCRHSIVSREGEVGDDQSPSTLVYSGIIVGTCLDTDALAVNTFFVRSFPADLHNHLIALR